MLLNAKTPLHASLESAPWRTWNQAHGSQLFGPRPSRGMAVRWARPGGPVHGPYAEAWFDETEQVHRVRLTEEGKAKAAEYLQRYPHPIALFISTWPATYRAARIAQLSDEEIDALCLEGVALAFARFDPTRGAAIGTAIVWGLRAAVGNAIRQARRAKGRVVVDFSSLTDRFDVLKVENDNLGMVAHAGSHSSITEEIASALAQANLTDRETAVLALRYGLNDGPPQTNAGIGKTLGYSTERVRQIQERAIQKIRKGIGLDVDWATTARIQVAAYLAAAQHPVSRAKLSKRTGVPLWQLREVLAQLVAEGVVTRERKYLSHARWQIVFAARK